MEMPVETPEWLNVCFVQKALRKSEEDNSINVIDIFTKPATKKGDNYTSDMIRAMVEYTQDEAGRKVTKKKSIIIKISPINDGIRKDLILSSPLFNTEMSMMSNTLLKMNQLLKFKHLLSAKCLYIQKEDIPLLVLEDLAPLGFRMADREAGLDLAHSILALQGLAKFHATSVAVCEKEPSQKQLYAGGMFNPDHPHTFRDFFNVSVESLGKEIETWPEIDQKYAKKMINIASKMYDIGMKVSRPREGDFCVINHGDFWVNNMLFKYNDAGKPISHICVDFQLAVYTSPAIDLLYFLSTSPSVETIENNKDVLLDEYLKTLSCTMKEIGCKTQPPTIEKLKDSLKERAAYGMIASFTVLPIVVCDKDNIRDLDEILGGGDDGGYENPSIKGALFRKIISKRIPMYDEMGLLDL
ncbi:uncharacterized protein LOC105186165 isoform X1 [Harpegnathos saltator]|uniref:uncharacterized protein LOC105186165 isoform X1 n=2 Tax=Harpegnathos saltator TaxID=610380 RepID=UPI000DBEF1EB|nr:uncharacterized protein LOC105186165 isoform X1 [Harpegnathos saltator]